MLEPVPTSAKSFQHVGPINVRLRVGTGAILPDLEGQCLANLNGTPFIAQVNYPITWPTPWLRNTRRLMEVVVVDTKDYDYPPVLSDDIQKGVDRSRYTIPQQETMSG